MSEEEQEAIKELKHYANITTNWKQKEFKDSEIDNYIKLTLNYIDRLQKENKELKEKLDFEERSAVFYQEKYFKIKNKIKHKIKYNKVFNDDISKYAVITLEELLKEN